MTATVDEIGIERERDARLASAPGIPVFAEMGLPALSFSIWQGLFWPRGTLADIAGRLNAAAGEAVANPAVRSRFTALGVEIVPREKQTPEAFVAFQRSEVEKWLPLIKELGIKVE